MLLLHLNRSCFLHTQGMEPAYGRPTSVRDSISGRGVNVVCHDWWFMISLWFWWFVIGVHISECEEISLYRAFFSSAPVYARVLSSLFIRLMEFVRSIMCVEYFSILMRLPIITPILLVVGEKLFLLW